LLFWPHLGVGAGACSVADMVYAAERIRDQRPLVAGAPAAPAT